MKKLNLAVMSLLVFGLCITLAFTWGMWKELLIVLLFVWGDNLSDAGAKQ